MAASALPVAADIPPGPLVNTAGAEDVVVLRSAGAEKALNGTTCGAVVGITAGLLVVFGSGLVNLGTESVGMGIELNPEIPPRPEQDPSSAEHSQLPSLK